MITRPRHRAAVPEHSEERRALVKQRLELMDRRDLMGAQYGLGELDERGYRIAVQAIDAAVSRVDEKLQALPMGVRTSRRLMGFDLGIDERREFLRSLTKSIEVFPKEFDPRIVISWA